MKFVVSEFLYGRFASECSIGLYGSCYWIGSVYPANIDLGQSIAILPPPCWLNVSQSIPVHESAMVKVLDALHAWR